MDFFQALERSLFSLRMDEEKQRLLRGVNLSSSYHVLLLRLFLAVTNISTLTYTNIVQFKGKRQRVYSLSIVAFDAQDSLFRNGRYLSVLAETNKKKEFTLN